MEAGIAADFYGCQDGHTIEVAGAEQAYVRADMRGTPTRVALPYDEVPQRHKHMAKPVYRLMKALYGHPVAGTFWEEEVDARLKSVGFTPLSPEWQSGYCHPRLKIYCVVYVDGFKISGPKEAAK